MDAHFYAERAAKSIPNVSIFEEEALRESPEFRERVIEAYQRIYGPESELKIHVDGSLLHLSWFRTTDKVISLPYEVYNAANPLAKKVYNKAVKEAEKRGLNPGKLNQDELKEFLFDIIKKVDNPGGFTHTHDGNYILISCDVKLTGEKKPVILICSWNSEKDTLNIGILVSFYTVETNLVSLPNPIVVSNYYYVPDSDSFERKYIRMGFQSVITLIILTQLYEK